MPRSIVISSIPRYRGDRVKGALDPALAKGYITDRSCFAGWTSMVGVRELVRDYITASEDLT